MLSEEGIATVNELIVASSPTPKYVVDEMAKAAGHEIVRLPPYHCELNPIELACSQVKRYIKEKKLFTLTAINELIFKGFDQVRRSRRLEEID